MFKNGFVHRVKANVSRPYAVDPNEKFSGEIFYDDSDNYVNSDSDFDDVVGKRQHTFEELNEPDDFIKKRFQMNEE